MAMALEGVRVLDASGPIGHYAGRLLADLGADVVKVEPPEGDPARQWAPLMPGVESPEAGMQFLLLNANKRGVTLDLSQPRGRELYLELVKASDIVIDSLQAQEAAALPDLCWWLGETYGPQAARTRWAKLSPGAQASLGAWLG